MPCVFKQLDKCSSCINICNYSESLGQEETVITDLVIYKEHF